MAGVGTPVVEVLHILHSHCILSLDIPTCFFLEYEL